MSDEFSHSTSPYADLFRRFVADLEQWHVSGAEPRDADREMRYDLDLEEARKRRLGLPSTVAHELDLDVLDTKRIL